MKLLTAIITAAAVAVFSGISARAQGGGLVVLGDSIATGYGLDGYSAGDNSSAQGSFANRLGALYPEYDNFARDGLTTEGLLAMTEDGSLSEALSGADTVVLSIGGNDLLMPLINAVIEAAESDPDLSGMLEGDVSGDYLDIMSELTMKLIEAAKSVDISKTGGNLDGIIAGIRNENPDCQIIILTVYDPFEGVSGMELFDVVAREKLAELNGEITACADKNGLQTVDVHSAFSGGAERLTNITSMDIHPNAEGHAMIFTLLSEAADIPTAPAFADNVKGSPDTGAEGIAAVFGILALSGAAVIVFRRK